MSQSNYHESMRQDGQVVADTRVRENRMPS